MVRFALAFFLISVTAPAGNLIPYIEEQIHNCAWVMINQTDLLERAKNGDEEAKQNLFFANARLYLKIGQRYGMERGEAFSLAWMGFERAFDSWDDKKSKSFSSYSASIVRWEMAKNNRETKDLIRLPSYLYSLVNRFKKEQEKLQVAGQACKDDDVIAGMRLGRKRRKTMGDVARLKDGRPDYEDEASLETILYEASNTTRVDRLEISRILGACFSRLSSFSQHFLDRLYGQGETVTDLAVQMNMTRYKVTLLKNQILSRLRTCLGEHGVGDEALSP